MQLTLTALDSLRRLPLLMAICCLPLGCAADKGESAQNTGAAPGSAASRVIVDTRTGRVRAPTAEERERLSSDSGDTASREPLRAIKGDDGIVRLHVPQSRYPNLEARQNADGELETRHAPAGQADE